MWNCTTMKRTVPQQQQHQASSVCGAAAAAAGRSRSTPNSSTPTTTSTLLDRRRTVMEFTLFLVLLCMTSTTTHCWQVDLRPNTQVDLKDKGDGVQTFLGNKTSSDHFKVLLVDSDSLLVGARNYVYNISLSTLQENKRIQWYSSPTDVTLCLAKHKTPEECQNYIKVIAKKSKNEILVCGTNAFKPWCRTYRSIMSLTYEKISEENGIAKCPYDPSHNNTAVIVDNMLYAATVADMTSRDALIVRHETYPPPRTEQHDSQWLNEPNFISSFEYHDMVYFFFRETAVEYINCGKAIYSRVARVCKKDKGGRNILRNTWTSYFKARLNCSIPGTYPFYFDELQSMSLLGQGNYMSSPVRTNRTDVVYAVFTTPRNSISGSAVCAFRFSDIQRTFEGLFKEQLTASSNWLPVSAPSPHPSKCVNDSTRVPDLTLDFIKKHPLMDQAVPAFGGEPVLKQTSFRSRFTQIAIDWHVLAGDNRYYDVIFVGTDDGRVVKSVNKGHKEQIESVVIEDIQVFDTDTPVINLKVYRSSLTGEAKLIVVSRDEIKSIPLHRCHLKKTCGECVAMQDPYCSWEDKCVPSNAGIQHIQDGRHPSCPYNPSTGTGNGIVTTPPTMTTCKPCKPCNCPAKPDGGGTDVVPKTTPGETSGIVSGSKPTKGPESRPPIDNHIPNTVTKGPVVGASTAQGNGMYSPAAMAIATVVSIILSLFIGFLVGYRLSLYRQANSSGLSPAFRDCNTADFTKGTPIMEKEANLNSNDAYLSVQKQLNVVLNVTPKSGKFPNGSTETKLQPSQKIKKVYV